MRQLQAENRNLSEQVTSLKSRCESTKPRQLPEIFDSGKSRTIVKQDKKQVTIRPKTALECSVAKMYLHQSRYTPETPEQRLQNLSKYLTEK